MPRPGAGTHEEGRRRTDGLFSLLALRMVHFHRWPAWTTRAELASVIRAMRIRKARSLKMFFMARTTGSLHRR